MSPHLLINKLNISGGENGCLKQSAQCQTKILIREVGLYIQMIRLHGNGDIIWSISVSLGWLNM